MPTPLKEGEPVEGGTMTCWDCQTVWKLGEETDAFFKHSCVVDSYEA